MLKSEIKREGDHVRLYVDGEPTSAMAYTTYFTERNCYADFIEAGYRIFFVNLSFTSSPINSAYTGFTPFRVGVFEDVASFDYSEFEQSVREILGICPDAIIIPRLYVSMPKWWVDSHPDEVVATKKGGYREALFSDAFRKDGGELLREAVRHISSSDYSYRIGGWQLCGGQTQEWFHHDNQGSLGKAAERQYPIWVEEAYGDVGASVPTPSDFDYIEGVRETQDIENARRYSLFSNIGVAKTVDHFAKIVKDETGGEQIVGAFYGYTFESGSTVTYGSHAIRYLLESENIDFLSSPNAYAGGRAFGIDWADMMPVDSVKHHGKLPFIECDIRTHLTIAVQDARPGEYPDDIYRTKGGGTVWVGPPTAELSREALRKCFAHQLTKGSAIWWFDMWGGWYKDSLLMDEVTRMKRIVDGSSESHPSPIRSEVVFFADETSYANLLSRSPHLSSITLTRTAMGNTGAPFDTYAVEDAEEVLGNYKAAVFPFPIPSEAGIRAMELCERLGIPYLRTTGEHPSLTSSRIRDFYEKSGVHLYVDEGDVIYVGDGYIGLHSAVAGTKTVSLPRTLKVTPVFGADIEDTITDKLTFHLDECATALFKLEEI